jgi:hypothetical protein
MECLRLAKELASDPEAIVRAAAQLYAFVTSGQG